MLPLEWATTIPWMLTSMVRQRFLNMLDVNRYKTAGKKAEKAS